MDWAELITITCNKEGSAVIGLFIWKFYFLLRWTMFTFQIVYYEIYYEILLVIIDWSIIGNYCQKMQEIAKNRSKSGVIKNKNLLPFFSFLWGFFLSLFVFSAARIWFWFLEVGFVGVGNIGKFEELSIGDDEWFELWESFVNCE